MARGRVCKTSGCRKQGRRQGFCDTHSSSRAAVPPVSAAPGPPRQHGPTLRARYPCKTLDGFCCLLSLSSKYIKELETETAAFQISGTDNKRRMLYHFTSAVAPAVVEHLRTMSPQLHFMGPLAWHSPALVVAPPLSQRRPQERSPPGAVHRDVEAQIEGYLTLLICLTDVTDSNGSITLWPGTQNVPPGHLDRAVQKLPSVVLTGPAGTAWLFDSRMLHQSNPNTTEQTRSTVQMFLNTSSVCAPEIAD